MGRFLRAARRRVVRLASLGAVGLGLYSCRVPREIPAETAGRGPVHVVPERSGTFAVFGDTQQWPVYEWFAKGGPAERAAVRERLRELDPDSIFLAGDIVGAGWVEGFWRQFAREFEGMRIFPALGNHDLWGWNRVGLTYYFETFPQVGRRRWYEVRQGPLALLVLDSNPGEMSDAEWEAQRGWLRERVAEAERDASVRGLVVVTHHPPVSSSGPRCPAGVKADLYEPAAASPKFLLAVSGHHHAYQHLTDRGRHCFVTGGGGAPLYYRPRELPEGVSLQRVRRIHHLLLFRTGGAGVTVEMHALGEDGGWSVDDAVEVPFQRANQ